MYRNLQSCCFRTSIRFYSSKSRVNLTQLKTSAAAIQQNDNPSPVITKTFLDPQKDFSKTVLKDSRAELSLFQLLGESRRVSQEISALTGDQQKLNCAFLAAGSFSAVTQYAIWMSGNTAIPLSPSHPSEQIEYFLNDSKAAIIVGTSEFESKLKPVADKLKKPLLLIDHKVQTANDHHEAEGILKVLANEIPCRSEDSAMIIYTSGTTNNPKGVVLSHGNLGAQISSLSSAWNMTASDSLLHSLPLHHVHGLINALLLPLAVGAKVTMLPKFDTDEAWSRLLNISSTHKDRVNMFMAVPTIYSYLIQEYDKLFKNKSQMEEYIKSHCSSKIRLMISGSAPLPETIFKRWKEITGHNLLERYGMTEIGMALSNPLIEDGSRKRLPGFTGAPLPLVEARIVNYENSGEVLFESRGEFNKGFWSSGAESSQGTSENPQDIVGNLQIKGPTIFKRYFNKPEATKESFTADGWFITGDSAAFSPQSNSFKILGRNSVDILKCKGYKISALEMETKLLEHPNILDCAVIGIPDEVVGQRILALIVTRNEASVEASAEINKWCQEKFASYSQPTIKVIESVPRNLMGKVNKKELVKLFS